MNKKQKWILAVAGVVTLGMLLFPPWYLKKSIPRGLFGLDDFSIEMVEHRFLLDAPPSASVHWRRLHGQLVIFWALAGICWASCKTRDKSE